jgi:hypothetical protein
LGFYAPAALHHQGRLGLPVGHATGPEIGTALPDIALPDARGNLVRLHDDRAGVKAAVVFYRSAVWCRHSGCAMRIRSSSRRASNCTRSPTTAVTPSFALLQQFTAAKTPSVRESSGDQHTNQMKSKHRRIQE